MTTATTPQARIARLLGECGTPAKQIKCYGDQIVVTCASRAAAEKFAAVIGSSATVRAVWQPWDAANGAGTPDARLRMVRVWRCAGRLA